MSAINDESVSLVVVTALPIEQAAVKRILDDVDAEIDGFIFGSVSVGGVVAHRLAVGILPQAGNTSAAAVVSDWSARFPNARHVVMVGIAGGIPSPNDPERHVRLGDVVVPDSGGVVEHDRGKVKHGEFEPLRGATPAPSSAFVSISRQLMGSAIAGEFPWVAVLEGRFSDPVWSRPGPETDVLSDESGEPLVDAHPDPDNYRVAGVPRLLAGLIASGDLVVKDRSKRDELASLGASAIEMEGSGVAASAWVVERGYFAVRGIVDYADGGKNNAWHPYGSAAAAAVLRTILDRKSPTTDEKPQTSLALDGVRTSYVEDIRRGVASAIVAAESSRVRVVGVVKRWHLAHDEANRDFVGWDDSGETAAVYLPRKDVQDFTSEIRAALEEARLAVGAEVLSSATAIALLAEVTEDGEAHKWLAALQRALDELVASSAIWPGAASGNRYEPPPLDDGGTLAASIESVRACLAAVQKCLAGVACEPAPDPPPPAQVEPSEAERAVQSLRRLAERLAPYRRVDTKPFSREDHDAAIAAAAALHHFSFTELSLAGLAMFADRAADVARNASDAEWRGLVDEAAGLEPLSLAMDVLLAYGEVLKGDDRGLYELVAAAAATRLEALPRLIERDEFWASTTGEAAQQLVRRWASASADHDAQALLGRLASGSEVGLCRTLDLLASTSQREDGFTGAVSIVRVVRDPFDNLSELVRPDEMRASIARYLPEALDVHRSAEGDAGDSDCLRFAVEYLRCFPADIDPA